MGDLTCLFFFFFFWGSAYPKGNYSSRSLGTFTFMSNTSLYCLLDLYCESELSKRGKTVREVKCPFHPRCETTQLKRVKSELSFIEFNRFPIDIFKLSQNKHMYLQKILKNRPKKNLRLKNKQINNLRKYLKELKGILHPYSLCFLFYFISFYFIFFLWFMIMLFDLYWKWWIKFC